MILIKIKPGVRLHGVDPEVFFAVIVAAPIWEKHGAGEFVITSGIEGRHSNGSDHYKGDALDFRTSVFPGGYTGAAARAAVAELKEALGADYDVILESDHCHVEFDPKGAY